MVNAEKHALAQQISLSLIVVESNQLLLLVEDDGLGFDVEMALANGRFGLVGMTERAALIGAEFSIESEPGQGSRIRLLVK